MNNKIFALAAIGLVLVVAALSFIGSQGGLQGRFPLSQPAEQAGRYQGLLQDEPLAQATRSITADADRAEVTIKESEPVRSVIGRWELEFEEGSPVCTFYEFVLRKGEDSLYLASVFQDAEILIRDDSGEEVGRWPANFNSSLSSFGSAEQADRPAPAIGKYSVELSATPKSKGIASYLSIDFVELVGVCGEPAQASSGIKLNILR